MDFSSFISHIEPTGVHMICDRHICIVTSSIIVTLIMKLSHMQQNLTTDNYINFKFCNLESAQRLNLWNHLCHIHPKPLIIKKIDNSEQEIKTYQFFFLHNLYFYLIGHQFRNLKFTNNFSLWIHYLKIGPYFFK